MKRILVAIDGSPRAAGVIAAAAQLAELSGARLVLYRAIGLSPEMPMELLAGTAAEVEERLRGAALAELERLAAGLRAGLVERVVTELATAWDGICTAARTLDADLIAIGSHGYGGIDRVLGTTAAKVANRADRNVLIVRTPL